MNKKVFISYAKEDIKTALEIVKILDSLRIQYFFDRKEIDWGDDLIDRIEKSLSDCTDVIVIVSEAINNSKWVKNEANAAIEKKKRILPLLLDPEVKLPMYLNTYKVKTNMDEVKKYFEDQNDLAGEKLDFQLPKLLLVDDEKPVLNTISELLTNAGFQVFATASRKEAEEKWKTDTDINIALIDLWMNDDKEPVKNFKETGFRIISKLKDISQSFDRNSVFAVLSAYDNHDSLSEAIRTGCDAFISKRWNPQQIIDCVKQLQQKIDTSRALFAFQTALERRSPYTAGHCERTVKYSMKIIPNLEKVDGNNFDLGACLTAARIHDIGKLSLPDHILIGTQVNLSREEKRIINKHVEIENILKPMGKAFDKITEIIRYHHLCYTQQDENNLSDYPKTASDGTPAPREENIPIEARILKVADVADAVLSDRLYSPGGTINKVKEIMKKGKSDGFFDPVVTDAFLNFISKESAEKEIDEIMEKGRIKRDYVLDLYYEVKSLTLGMLEKILEFLSNIYLEDGRAVDRVILESGPVMIHHKQLLGFSVVGTKKDLESLLVNLKQKIQDEIDVIKNADKAGFAELDIMAFFIRMSRPVEITLRKRDSNESIDTFIVEDRKGK